MRAFAWSGALLFAASLTYCLLSYAITMGRPAPESAGFWPPFAIDAALFSAFALHHSVFARERVRAWVARVLPPKLERSFYVWVASLMLAAVCALWQPVAGIAWQIAGPPVWLLRILQVIGVWLTLRSAAVIDVLGLAGVRQVDAAARPEFKTVGPYGWVRHPIYTGWFLVVLAAPTMTMTRLAFAGISCLYLLVAIPFEEGSLRATTGDAYTGYMAKVRWKLVPGVY